MAPIPEAPEAIRAYLADQAGCPSVGLLARDECAPPPGWQVDALAAEYRRLRAAYIKAWRQCYLSRVNSLTVPAEVK